jgi:site-specific DNA-methyltransferase (adenine-specific)
MSSNGAAPATPATEAGRRPAGESGGGTMNTIAIHNADCLAVLPTLRPGSVKVVVTSPPYNLGKRYSLHNDDMPEPDYLAWQGNVAAQLARVLHPQGHLFLNIGWNASHPWRAVDVALQYRRHFALQNSIAWLKSVAINGNTLPEHLKAAMHDRQVGHFQSLTSERFLNPVFEPVWHFTPTGRSPLDRTAEGVGVPYVWADQPARFGHHRERHCRGNAVHIPYRTTQSKADKDDHPSPYPVELAEYCLRLAAAGPADVALDPFMGTGATLLAARRVGCQAIGIEIDPAYCEAARRRLETSPDRGGQP